MSRRHRPPSRGQAALAHQLAEEHEPSRLRAVLVVLDAQPAHHGGKHVQERRVLAQHVDAAQRVQRHGALPAGLALHQRRHKGPRAVVERDVVRVGGDARRVKGHEDVDVGGGLGGVAGSLAG